MPEISEKSFEDAVEAALLAGGPDAAGGVVREPTSTYGDMVAGGYRRRTARDYDVDLGLIAGDALDFVEITQPHEWAKLRKIRGKEARDHFTSRLAREVRTPSTSTSATATRAIRCSSAASPISRWTWTTCWWRRGSTARRPCSCPSTRVSRGARATRRRRR
ncbi:MAG TPA: hypothetical protein VGG06_27695 [Thermoanaerobaculia bacterium]|jgi:hypothetical protein